MTRFSKVLTLTTCFGALLGMLNTTAMSATIEGGNARRGKELAIENCRPCHIRGAEAGTMSPISKTQRQWDRFVKKGRHYKIAPGAWEPITEQDLKDVFQFMYDHAADSDQPQTCGR